MSNQINSLNEEVRQLSSEIETLKRSKDANKAKIDCLNELLRQAAEHSNKTVEEVQEIIDE